MNAALQLNEPELNANQEEVPQTQLFNIDKHGKFIKCEEELTEGDVDAITVREVTQQYILGSMWVEVDKLRKANVSVILKARVSGTPGVSVLSASPSKEPNAARFEAHYYTSHLLADMAFNFIRAQTEQDIEKIPHNFIGRKLGEHIAFLKKNIA